MRRFPAGLRDVRVVLGVIVGMLLAGFLIPLASSEPKPGAVAAGRGSPAARAATASGGSATASGGSAAPGQAGGAAGGGTAGPGAAAAGGADNASAGGTAAAANVERTASDQGVTPDTIKLG